MKIPLKYQVFDEDVEISEKDHQRLSVHLIGWNRLNEIFLLGSINESDLRRLVIMEVMGARRSTIINRLLGRLQKLQRKQIDYRIAKLSV
jgi:hypothetical protein